jgi:hypothetical protein
MTVLAKNNGSGMSWLSSHSWQAVIALSMERARRREKDNLAAALFFCLINST